MLQSGTGKRINDRIIERNESDAPDSFRFRQRCKAGSRREDCTP